MDATLLGSKKPALYVRQMYRTARRSVVLLSCLIKRNGERRVQYSSVNKSLVGNSLVDIESVSNSSVNNSLVDGG